jgi:cell wall-associated hydrolase
MWLPLIVVIYYKMTKTVRFQKKTTSEVITMEKISLIISTLQLLIDALNFIILNNVQNYLDTITRWVACMTEPL